MTRQKKGKLTNLSGHREKSDEYMTRHWTVRWIVHVTGKSTVSAKSEFAQPVSH